MKGQQPPTSVLRARLLLALRRTSAASVLHSQAVARRVGITPSDLECLDMILLGGPATAGQIGQRTGLTSGAVTGLIDRLEKQGLVERAADANDRRKVLVQVRKDRIHALHELFEPMRAQMEALVSSYSDDQLAVIADFGERAVQVAMACVEQLNRKPAE